VRITFLTWRDLDHPDGGGSEVYVEEMAAELAARGHQVTVRCARAAGAPRETRRRGYRVVRRGGRLSVYPRGLLWLLGREGRRSDVVVDVINAIPFAAPLVRRRGVVGLVHHLHRDQWRIIYPGLSGRVGWWVESHLIPRLYRRTPVVTVSDTTRTELAGLGLSPERLHVVRNGTPVLPAPRTEPSDRPSVVVLSRLVPHKQIEHAVDAVVALRDRFPGLRLHLVGDGWWADRIDEHVARVGAADLVLRHGHVDEQTKADVLAAAWVLAMPSVKEGWCLAVVEAASVGTPAVAYRAAGGVTESIADGVTGLVVDDRAGLTDALARLLSDERLRRDMGTAARERAAGFTWPASADAFERLLDEAHSP
jgi:glycosyltransferase involved in cell wall biosynthesis